jgi:GNAT superfamily N-acetyltransferase
MDAFRYQIIDLPSEAEREAINSVLREHNRSANPIFWAALDEPDGANRPLNVIARDDVGQVIGGLFAETRFTWLKIAVLAVHPQFRRRAVATHILATAEANAVRRDCKYAYVDTMEYQSPGFYQRCGYTTVGTLHDWDSHGHAKYFLTKTLS